MGRRQYHHWYESCLVSSNASMKYRFSSFRTISDPPARYRDSVDRPALAVCRPAANGCMIDAHRIER
jgi:hypothetical protein